MKTRYWVIILLVVAIVLFIWGSFFHPFFSGKRYIIMKQYEVFRDLLAVILTLAGLGIALLGTAMYAWVSRTLNDKVMQKIDEVDFQVRQKVGHEVDSKIDEKIKEVYSRVDEKIKETNSKIIKRIECEKDSILSNLSLELSIAYWKQYETKYDGNGNIVLDKAQKNYLNLAIQTGDDALKMANKLDKKDFEKVICRAKNNLAYHLVVRGLADDFQIILDWAEHVSTKARNFDYRDTWIWVETYAFSLITIGRATSNNDQIEKGMDLIKGLMQREEIGSQDKRYIQRKYKKLL